MRVIKYFHTVNLPFLFPSNHKILSHISTAFMVEQND